MSVVDLNEKRCPDCGLFLPCHCKIEKKDFFGVEHHEEVLEEPVIIVHKRQKRFSYPMPGTHYRLFITSINNKPFQFYGACHVHVVSQSDRTLFSKSYINPACILEFKLA